MSNFIFTLIEVVLVDTLIGYCSNADLMHFDSSVCNKSDRKLLLNLFRHCGFVLNKCTKTNLVWASFRGVKFNCFYLQIFDGQFLEYIPKLVTSETKIIEFMRTNITPGVAEAQLKFINACPKLRELAFHGTSTLTNHFLMGIDTNIFKQLYRLQMDYCVVLQAESAFAHLALHCKSLKCFEFASKNDITEQNIIEIVCQNPDLEIFKIAPNLLLDDELNINLTDEFYLELLRFCPKLTNISIVNLRVVSNHIIMSTLLNATNKLVYFQLTQSSDFPYFEYKATMRCSVSVTFGRIYDDYDELYFTDILRAFGNRITSLSFFRALPTRRLIEAAGLYCSSTLKSLRVWDCELDYVITDLKLLIEKCQRLSTFKFAAENKWTTSNLVELFTAKYTFRRVTLSGINDMNFSKALMFLENNPMLKECVVISDLIDKDEKSELKKYMEKRRHVTVGV
jgi:hypothetical protein